MQVKPLPRRPWILLENISPMLWNLGEAMCPAYSQFILLIFCLFSTQLISQSYQGQYRLNPHLFCLSPAVVIGVMPVSAFLCNTSFSHQTTLRKYPCSHIFLLQIIILLGVQDAYFPKKKYLKISSFPNTLGQKFISLNILYLSQQELESSMINLCIFSGNLFWLSYAKENGL